MATWKQKVIIRFLAAEGSIVTAGRGKYSVRDSAKNTVLRCDYNTIFRIKNFLKKKTFKNSSMWHLNKAEVLKLRKNHSFKKIYLDQRGKPAIQHWEKPEEQTI
jgi:hypothetical protein